MASGTQLEDTPLAVIGMACRLPGADDLEEYWRLVVEGRSAVGELPPEHFNRADYYDPRRGMRGKSYSALAALTSRRPFDPKACPIPEQFLERADVVHLTMCEVAAQACRHAGRDPFDLPLRNVGVFIGHTRGSSLAGNYAYAACVEEAAQYLREVESFRSLPAAEQEAVIGEVVARVRQELPRNAVAGRDLSTQMIAGLIAKAFELTGPFMAINAACASSLQALLLAARALQLGRIDMAIVGGASHYKADTLVLFSHAQSLSAAGSRPFDADADGLILGEGYGAVVLKTLPRALADKDPIHAVVRGIGVSSDGQGKSLWAPRKEGQIKAVQRAYAAGIDMGRLQYIEAHATSTPLGDATELTAIADVLRKHVPASAKIPIGSVKANIGHTLEAAGIAGFIKTVLAMQHGVVPPAINVKNLNPQVDWDRSPFHVPLSAAPWPAPADGHPRRAAVNSFGIGGLNVHVVLDQFFDPSPKMVSVPKNPPHREKNTPPAGEADAVAVIGMGCIFPGARTLEAFWDLLVTGRDPKCHAPADRWRADLAFEPGSREPYRSGTTLGGFITGFHYDWRAHKVPPKQVASADPLQFMLLDAADQALHDSGYDKKPFDRTRTGVVVGTVVGSDFATQLQMGLRLADFNHSLTHVLQRHGVPADRIPEIARRFADVLLEHWPALEDETGSFTTSSLVSRITKTFDLMGGGAAIDSGATSSPAALAACVDMLLAGDCDLMFCAAGQRRMGLPVYDSLSQEGILALDEQPRSPLDARSCGVVPGEGVGVLLLKRLSDALRDGDRIRIVVRSVAAAHSASWETGQRLAAERSFEMAGVKAADMALMEIDGSGVPQRDRELWQAIVSVHGMEQRSHPLLIGSLVGQIGHTEGASGMASLLKASMAIEHGEMPGTVGLESPADILAEKSAVVRPVVQRTTIPRGDSQQRRLAGVSACGKGLAYHVVLEAANGVPARLPNPATRSPLAQQEVVFRQVGSRRPRICFLFPGQASQYPGMLREVIQQSASAAAAVHEMDAVLARSGYPSFAEMSGADSANQASELWLPQVLILAADTIMHSVLAGWGIRPDLISGHSYGEYPALVAAGAWDFEQALRATRARCDAIRDNPAPAGGMLAVVAPPAVVERLAARIGGNVYVANHNAPDQTVVAGRQEALAEFVSLCAKESLKTQLLPVPAPFHTPLLEAATGALRRALHAERIRPPRVPVLSSVTNRYAAEPDEIRANLVAQLVTPVRYVELIQRIAAEDETILVEVGPKQTLTQLNRRILAGENAAIIACDNPRRPGMEQFHQVRALLESSGAIADGHVLSVREAGHPVRSSEARPNASQAPILHFDATARRRGKMRAVAEANTANHVEAAPDPEPSLLPVPPVPTVTVNRDPAGTLPPEDAAPVAVAPQAADLESFLVNFVVEQTGYPAEVVELDADLEADLGIDSIKKAQLFGELQEYFDVKPSENLSLSDFPTLRHVLNFLRSAPGKEPPTVSQPVSIRASEADAAEDIAAATAMPAQALPLEHRAQGEQTPVAAVLSMTRLEGTPYEMGRQHGLAKREEIRAILRRYADLPERALVNLPNLERIAADPAVLFGPDELDELQGIADAVEVPLGNVIAHNLLQFPDGGSGCAHFAVAACGNADAGMIHGANEDLPLSLTLGDCLARLVQVRCPGYGIPHLTFSVVGTVGGLNGVNASGLAVSSSMLLDRPGRAEPSGGRLHSVLIKSILEGAPDIESALQILARTPKRGAWGLCISHAPSDRLCYVEFEGPSIEVRDNRAAVTASNHGLLLPPGPAVPDHSVHRLKLLEQLLAQTTQPGITVEGAQAALRGRYDPGRGRETQHRTMNTLCRVDNQISIVMEFRQGRVWVTPGPLAGDQADYFHCLLVNQLLPTPDKSQPAGGTSGYGGGVSGKHRDHTADLHLEKPVAERFVMRMVDAPLPHDTPLSPVWQGRAIIVGRNPTAEALRARLEADGVVVGEVPVLDDVDRSLEELDRIWRQGPAPHLFLMTGRDGEPTDPYEEAAWQRRRRRGVVLPFLVCQRWVQLAAEAELLDRCTLVAATALGGDFGFSGHVASVESGALTGLIKAVYLELGVLRKLRGLRSKAIDAPIEESPATLAEDICRELAAGTRDYEVAYVQRQRRLQRAVVEPALLGESADIRPGGTWVVTGGARGVTAACAVELGRRFALKLHLIGTSPPPQIDPAWRDLSDAELKTLKSSVMSGARRRGEVPDQAWSRVEKAIEMDRSLRDFAQAGVEATYHVCDVSDRTALSGVLQQVREKDGPIEGILHGAGIQQACRFERKQRDVLLATIGAKVDGACNLMALTRHDPLRHFIGFGSVAGRLGGNGQADYCVASDMLCKLIDWYRSDRPRCRAVGFHWTAWDEVGMACEPAMRVTLQMVSRQFMPKREGVCHLLRELYADAPEREVLIVDRDYYRKFYGSEGAAKQALQRPSQDAVPVRAPEASTGEPTASHKPIERYVLRMVDAPLADPAPPALQIEGPALILGENATAAALREQLARLGVDVFMLPASQDAASVIAALEDLWRSHRPRLLFLLTARDDAAGLTDREAWQRRRARGIIVPYLVTQRWYQLLATHRDRGRATLLAATALGGDFGFSGNVAAPEGGAMTGLLKSLYIEDTRKPHSELRVKVIDAPGDEPPDILAAAMCRELAADRPEVEVSWTRGRRRVVRPLLAPVAELPRENLARGGTWVITGGGRGITALAALEFGRRYGLKLHLIGTSPHPREDAPWRHYSDAEMRALKSSVTQESLAAGRTPDAPWEAIQADIEICTTLRNAAQSGVRAAYYSCDVADWDALAKVLDAVRRTDGPIDGVLHGAGFGRSHRFDKTPLDKLARTIDSKVGGAVALMALTRNDPLRCFIGFGSISGRFGGNGLTDYAAANDMLCKLVDWFRHERCQCASACFHWESWAGAGMAMRPRNMGARDLLKLDFMSPEAGIEHLDEERRAGLPEGEVLITSGEFYKRFYPQEATATTCPAIALPRSPAPSVRRPLIDAVRPLDNGRGLVAEARLDPIGDVFLRDHVLREKPLLPGVVGIEALAEAAAVYHNDGPVVAFRDIEFLNGLIFHSDQPITAKITVTPDAGALRCVLSSDVRDRRGRVVEENRPYVAGIVEFSASPPAVTAKPATKPIDWQPSRWGRKLLRHGESLRCLKAYSHASSEGWGRIVAPPPHGLAGSRPASGWILPVAVLDSCLVACGHYLFAEFQAAVELPQRLDRLRLGRLPREGESCLAWLQFRKREAGHSHFDFSLFGDDDTLILQAEGYRTVLVSSGRQP